MSAADALPLAREKLADGDLGGALAHVQCAITVDPQNPQAHVLHGRLLRLQGKLEESVRALERALELRPDDVDAMTEKAVIALELRDFDTSMDLLSGVIYRDAGNARAHHEMGRLHRMQGALDEALACQLAAIEYDPGLVEAYCELGWLRNKRGEFNDALEVYERALAIDPENLTVHHNLGLVLGKLEHYERALEILEALCARLPTDHAGSWLNLATALAAQGDVRRADQIYQRVLAVEPNHVTARWNRAHFLLAEHDFERGWRDYEWRFVSGSLGPPRLIPHRPWRGEPLDGKSILVSAEQGLGDQIMFASCLPDILARAGEVTVECSVRLEALFRRSFPRARVIGSLQELNPPWLREVGEVDFHAAMGSLPTYLRTCAADFPSHEGYFRADPARVRHWRSRLAELGDGIKIGLSWRGGSPATRKRLRSIELADLRELCEMPGCRFVSLQYGQCTDEIREFNAGGTAFLPHWQDAIDDYDETAALCSALDLTISVCTSVIHLNGALGRPVWILVPSAPEWRYGFSGERLPWYPSARLYRQDERSTWAPVLARVRSDLAHWPPGKS